MKLSYEIEVPFPYVFELDDAAAAAENVDAAVAALRPALAAVASDAAPMRFWVDGEHLLDEATAHYVAACYVAAT
jgi:hypothetical protein